jgi:predicted DCC family thiol-disulfide oxidoreductase YuxK
VGENEAVEPDNVVVFDGVCNLCNRYVRFVIERDPDALFRFAPLQSPAGALLLRRHGFVPEGLDTFVLIKGGRVYARSDAALEIARHLRGPWRLLSLVRVIPRPLRNWLYDIIARNRYRWFGKLGSCAIPGAEHRARFLDEGP